MGETRDQTRGDGVTTCKGPADGFGVHEELTGGAVLYGCAPAWEEPPNYPISPYHPPTLTPPVFIPPLVPWQRGDGLVLTVTGPEGVVLTVALTNEQWEKLRPAILEAAK